MQIAFNRSWKLFLIGLFQNESINRFFSMKAINYSVKHVNDTLLDIETLKVKIKINHLLSIIINILFKKKKKKKKNLILYNIKNQSFQL